eukprot:337178-Karenia_brevis.AAC.1
MHHSSLRLLVGADVASGTASPTRRFMARMNLDDHLRGELPVYNRDRTRSARGRSEQRQQRDSW